MRLKNMKLIQYLLVSSIGLLLFACTETDGLETHAGKTGFMISLADGSVGVEARTVPSALPDPAKTAFQIQVLKAGTATSVEDVPYKENQLIEVAAGVYDVVATYGDVSTLALDKPCYRGIAEDQTVSVDKTTSVTINCTVANALLSVKYDDSVKKFSDIYSDYYVKVSVNGASLDIKDTEKSAYFQPETSFEVYFCATKKDENEEKSMKLNLSQTSLKAAEHLILTLSPEPDKSGADISVTKEEIKSVTINETIPMEWLPKPKVTAEGFDENNTLTFVETETKEAKLNLELSSALQDVTFKFNFQDEQEQFASLEDREYLWSVDKETIETLGITVSDENINLNGLLAKLQTNAGTFTTNTIEIDVQANNRWSSEDKEANRTYKMICNKPEFSIAVQEGNVWSKTFTIDEPTITTGNVDVLKEKLQYQYKAKGDETWQTCSNGLMQAFAEHPENEEYQVRAFYREGITSNVVDVTLETPAQLPNSGMEKWQVEELEGTIRTYYPWNSGETSFWNTNNDYTTRYRVWGSTAAYNCFPAVSYVSGRNGGKAAEIRNTASGSGNTNAWIGSITYEHNKVAGELFIGELSIDGNAYTINKGKEFTSRPTALHFYYKYAPHNNDTWKASIELLDENKNTIISQNVTASSSVGDFTEMTVSLNYEEGKTYAKCKYVCVIFSSTINTGDDLQYEKQTYYLQENGNSLKYSNALVGSVLTIDDISLIYDK